LPILLFSTHTSLAYQIPFTSDWSTIESKVEVIDGACVVLSSDQVQQHRALDYDNPFEVEKFLDQDIYRITAISSFALNRGIETICPVFRSISRMLRQMNLILREPKYSS
jgi:hypothetical protein